jgi:hypothetical protein
MNSQQHAQLANVQILTALYDCGGYMVSEPVLHSQVNLMVIPPLTTSEFSACLKRLEADGLISGVNPELGGPVKWKITDKGRASI